jgi:hypothetical protein
VNEEQTRPEDQLVALQQKFDETSAALAETRRQLESVERRQKIDQALIEADTVDLEAARLLTEVAVGLMDDGDVQSAVDELRRRKPYLFRRSAPPGGAMSARPRPGAPAQDAAEQAAVTGNRRDLLRYLRTRRTQRN